MSPVQSSSTDRDTAPTADCCGGPVSNHAPDHVDACCVEDVTAKAAGEEDCGCSEKTDDLSKTAAKTEPRASFCC